MGRTYPGDPDEGWMSQGREPLFLPVLRTPLTPQAVSETPLDGQLELFFPKMDGLELFFPEPSEL